MLRIKAESLTPAPVLETDAVAFGSTVQLSVRDASGIRFQGVHPLSMRGQFVRLDFGTALPDSDNDGLLDAWELVYFGNLNSNVNSDPDGDGVPNDREYAAHQPQRSQTTVFSLPSPRPVRTNP